MLSLLFMGTAPFAVPSLRALVEAGHDVRAVVTQPDRPTGRGLRLRPSAVKVATGELGLTLLQPEKASDPGFLETARALAPAAIVVVAYGQILRPALLELPPLGCINVHASLLPELRGAAPIQWAILRGLPETGVTTMFMDAGLDTGDLILQKPVPIARHETAGDLADRLAPLGAELLVETLRRLEAGTAPRIPQDPARATLAPLLRREDGALDWSRSAVELRNRIHGCNPWPGARARRGDAGITIWRAEVAAGAASAPPGSVLDARRLVLAAGTGAIRLLEVQPESRGRLSGEAFCRGYRVIQGERWLPG